jgi:hypothetical protein
VVDVSIGKPISSVGRKHDELMVEVEAWIESEMQRLDPGLPQIRQNCPCPQAIACSKLGNGWCRLWWGMGEGGLMPRSAGAAP